MKINPIITDKTIDKASGKRYIIIYSIESIDGIETIFFVMKGKVMFEKELSYFIAHQEELVKKYNGKILVLKDESVFGVYNNTIEAYTSAKKVFPLGSFMLQPCNPGSEAYTVTVSSSIAF